MAKGNILKPVLCEDTVHHNGREFKREQWLTKLEGYHRDGDPAVVEFFANDEIKEESWYQFGKLYRPRSDNPSHTVYAGNRIALIQMWTDSLGRLHRHSDKPARLEYNRDGDLIKSEWWIDGRRYRYNDNATIVTHKGTDVIMKWHEDDKLVRTKEYHKDELYEELWFNSGDIHREGAPAKITYRTSTGNIWRELWYKDGLKHRDEGPAHLIYDDKFNTDNTLVQQQWALDGEFIEFNDWLEKSSLPLHEKIAMKMEM